jgi:Ca2+-binding EF-hand superfamily protein
MAERRFKPLARRKSVDTLTIIHTVQILSQHIQELSSDVVDEEVNAGGDMISSMMATKKITAIDEVFAEFDINGDGEIDCDEFVFGVQKIAAAVEQQSEEGRENALAACSTGALKSVFMLFDVDGSGAIDPAEFRDIFSGKEAASCMFQVGTPHKKDEASHKAREIEKREEVDPKRAEEEQRAAEANEEDGRREKREMDEYAELTRRTAEANEEARLEKIEQEKQEAETNRADFQASVAREKTRKKQMEQEREESERIEREALRNQRDKTEAQAERWLSKSQETMGINQQLADIRKSRMFSGGLLPAGDSDDDGEDMSIHEPLPMITPLSPLRVHKAQGGRTGKPAGWNEHKVPAFMKNGGVTTYKTMDWAEQCGTPSTRPASASMRSPNRRSGRPSSSASARSMRPGSARSSSMRNGGSRR